MSNETAGAEPGPIMVVDDDEVDAGLLVRLLGEVAPNYQTILRYGDPEEALSRVVEDAPVVVFVDYKLGTMEGPELIAQMRDQYPDADYVLLTGIGGESVAVASLRAGAADYIDKHDLSSETLNRCIRHMEARRRARHERAEARLTRQHLAAIVRSSQDAIISTRPDGTVVTWNRGAIQIYGRLEQEMIGAMVWDLAAPDEVGSLEQLYAAAQAGEIVEPMDSIHLDAVGRRIGVRISLSLMRQGEKMMGVSLIIRQQNVHGESQDRLLAHNMEMLRTAETMEARNKQLKARVTELIGELESTRETLTRAQARVNALTEIQKGIEEPDHRVERPFKRTPSSGFERIGSRNHTPTPAPTPVPASSSGASPEPRWRHDEGPRIVLVEAPGADRARRSAALIHQGVRVLTARDAREALKLSQEHSVHALIIYAGTTRVEELKLIDRLHRDQRTTDLPIIALTESTSASDQSKVREAGALSLIPPPYAPEQIAAALAASVPPESS